MVTEVNGLKSLLLDEETSSIISLVYSRSAILEKEVFLLDLLSKEGRERMTHLKCVVYVRPTQENVTRLCSELRSPKYGEYHIFFSNIVGKPFLEQMAFADESEVVKQVQEFYGDFYAINSDLFSLNIPTCIPLARGNWDQKIFGRMTSGVLSVLLAMKRRPMLRFQANSGICESFVNELKEQITRESALFDFRRSEHCLLLILDRREDPVTPILTQWTYQAMIHEMLGTHHNRVTLPITAAPAPTAGNSKEKIKDDSENEVVLSAKQDHFFDTNMFCNWGDLCFKLKQFVDEYKAKTDHSENIQSIEDIKAFMRDFPAFRTMSGNVSKHVSLVGILGDKIKQRDLLTVSLLEQELSCHDSHKEHFEKLMELLQNPRIDSWDLLRLVLLYALRYEKSPKNAVPQFRELLLARGTKETDISLLDGIIRYGGAKVRIGDLFNKEGFARIIPNLTKGFRDVTNVYTQHEPLVKSLLEKLTKGSLSQEQYPFVPGFAPSGGKWKPKEIIIFIIGGATFEEALFVNAFNEPHNLNNSVNCATAAPSDPKGKAAVVASDTVRCLLGSTSMLNSKKFLEEVAAFR